MRDNHLLFSVDDQMRVAKNPDDVGRCGCGRREYCDGSHGLTEAQWQAVRAKELARMHGAAIDQPDATVPVKN
ncbi:MAG: hypothetical protein Q7J47_16490 [Azoarcus sp.]|nr:hypothetical protein [Azoarcus sp.]